MESGQQNNTPSESTGKFMFPLTRAALGGGVKKLVHATHPEQAKKMIVYDQKENKFFAEFQPLEPLESHNKVLDIKNSKLLWFAVPHDRLRNRYGSVCFVRFH